MNDTLRWLATAALAVICIWVTAMNWGVFVKRFVQRGAAPSWIPLLGGGAGAGALWIAPASSLAHFWWLPLLLDWGSLPGIAHAIAVHLFSAASRKQE